MKKNTLLLILLTLSIASTVKVDAISVFGRDLNFGKIFTNIKSGKPVGGVIDSKVSFEVTFPKKGAELTIGNIYNLTWKTSDKLDVYNLILEGTKDINIGKAYNKGKTFSWLISKDVKPGNYKLSFVDKYGNKYKSDTFKIVAPVVVAPIYKLESVVGAPVTDKSYYNVDYKVTSKSNTGFTLKINCPSGVSATIGNGNSDKCNKDIDSSLFGRSTSNADVFGLPMMFTNKNKTAQLVTAELFVGGKSYGKVANMVEATKEVVVSPVISFISPAAGSNMYLGKTNGVTWTTNVSDPNIYSVYLVGGSLGSAGSILLGTTIPNQKTFTFTFPDTVKPGSDYQISFSGKGATGGLSPKFNIITFKQAPVDIVKISSNAITSRNNNVDTYAYGTFKIMMKPNGSDILSSSVSAIIGIKDIIKGNILSTVEVKGSVEGGAIYIYDSSSKMVEFSSAFPASVFPLGTTNYNAFIKSINYKKLNSDTVNTITDDMDLFDSNFTSFDKTEVSTTTLLTRNIGLGASGDDVLRLKKYLVSAGYMDMNNPATSTNYFGNETLNAVKAFQVNNGISPADGYVGPLTRIKINEKMIVIKEM